MRSAIINLGPVLLCAFLGARGAVARDNRRDVHNLHVVMGVWSYDGAYRFGEARIERPSGELEDRLASIERACRCDSPGRRARSLDEEGQEYAFDWETRLLEFSLRGWVLIGLVFTHRGIDRFCCVREWAGPAYGDVCGWNASLRDEYP